VSDTLIVLDPTIYRREVIAQALALHPGADVATLCNPFQEALLTELGRANVGLTSAAFPSLIRNEHYAKFKALCRRARRLDVEVDGATVNIEVDNAVTFKRHSHLLLMNEWRKQRGDVTHANVHVMSADPMFMTGIAELMGAKSAKKIAAGPVKVKKRSPLQDRLRDARDTMNIKLARAKRLVSRKPLLYARADREIGELLPQLEDRFTVLNTVPAMRERLTKGSRVLGPLVEPGPPPPPHSLESLHAWYMSRMGPTLCNYASELLHWRRFFGEIKADAFLVASTRGAFGTGVTDAKTANQQVMMMQHGGFAFIDDRYDYHLAVTDHFLAWYRQPGKYVDPEHAPKFRYVGYPKGRAPSAADMKRPDKPVVLVAPTRRHAVLDDTIYQMIETCRSLFAKVAEVVVRLPRQDPKGAVFPQSDRSLDEDIRRATVVITDMSTIVIDASGRGRPAVLYDYLSEPSFYAKEEMCVVVDNEVDLEREVSTLLTDPAAWAKEADRQRARFNAEIGWMDPSSVVQLIAENAALRR